MERFFNSLGFHIFILLSIFTITTSAADCVIAMHVKTGSRVKAPTDSKISLALYNNKGVGIQINDLKAWGGLQGPNYKYFGNGSVDIFSGIVPCLAGPLCAMNLTSDGSGSNNDWYCEYVVATLVSNDNDGCSRQVFDVKRWLSTDFSPFTLTSIVNNCKYENDQKEGDRSLISVTDTSVISSVV